METTLLWKLIKEVVPSLKETLLRVQCPEGQICHFYKLIRTLVSADMKGELSLNDGQSRIFLENIQDTKTAAVSMNNDNLGMPLEDFYEMFKCMPSVLGVHTPITDSVVSFLDGAIQARNTTLKRLTFDLSVLSGNSKDLLLDLIGRCSLHSLDVQYHEDAVDLIVQMVRILNEVELTVHCKTELIRDTLEHLRGVLSSDRMERCLRLTDDSSTIIFDNVCLTQFRLVRKEDVTARNELFDVNEILSAAQGFSLVIIPAAAAKLEQWTRSFPSPYKKICMDTSKLYATGIDDMVQVISRSTLLSLTVFCSKGEKTEKDKRKKFQPLILPYLAGCELYIHCPVKEFAEMWQLLRAHESLDQPNWGHYLCDGERRLVILSSAAPKLVIHGARATHYKDAPLDMEDGLGDTMFELGPYVEHLDMGLIIFSDKDAALWLKSTSSIPQLRLNFLRLSTAHLTYKGFDHLQYILSRSNSLAHFAFICECNQPISTAAIDMLLQNKSTIRELVLRGSKTQQWIQALSALLPDRESLPLMTSLSKSFRTEKRWTTNPALGFLP